MTKKILTLLLALVMALSLVACANQPPVSDDTTNDDSQIHQEIVDNDTNNDNMNTDVAPNKPDNDSQEDAAVGSDSASTDNSTEENKPSGGTDKPQVENKPTGNEGTATAKPNTPASDSNNNANDNAGSTAEKKPTATLNKEHKHSYTSKVVWPTCTAGGYTLYTCSCGDSYKDNATKKLTHSYCEKVVAPTATAQGYTLHTCILCDDTYKDNFKPATGSNNNTPSVGGSTSSGNTGSTTPTTPSTPSTPAHKHNYTSTVVPGNCTTKGYTSYVCSCGDSYEDNYTGGNGHSWEAVYDEVPVYETVCITRCGHCHADITGNVSAHMKEEALAGNGSRSYQEYEQVQVGTATEIVGYACSVCGTAK